MRCAVLGDPVGHSLSPVLHRAGYLASGLDWSYDAVRVGTDELASFVDGLGEEWRGLSLTMPLKRLAVPLARSLGRHGDLAGAVNTLVRDGAGWHGDNTDLPGAVAALRERYDGPVDRVAVLGGGATATSVGLATCELGARSVVLLVRSPERAEEARSRIAAHPGGPSVDIASVATSVPADVLVSTVPASAQSPEIVAAHAAPAVFDVVYDPWPTPLAAAALARGSVLVSGLDLLVHQAARQFELFTGMPEPLAAMRAAGEAELALRAGS